MSFIRPVLLNFLNNNFKYFLNDNYREFLFRQPPTDLSVIGSGRDGIPNLEMYTLLFTIYFCLLFYYTPKVVSMINKNWYNGLDKIKRDQMPSYIVCLFHHFVVVPSSYYQIYLDYNIENIAQINYPKKEGWITSYCLAYLIADSIFYAIPEAIKKEKKDFQYIIHHIVTLSLILPCIYSENGSVMRFIPHLLISDTSNILLNLSWLVSLTSFRDHIITKSMKILFVITYFILRAYHMPIMFWAVATYDQYINGLGIGKYMIIPLILLQWYWSFLIISKLPQQLTAKKNDISTDNKNNKNKNK